MNRSLVLCVVAAVLIAEGFCNFQKRQEISTSIFSKKRFLCSPGDCIVFNKRLCRCLKSGFTECPHLPKQVGKVPNRYCNCEPGFVFNTVPKCTCPESGVVSMENCTEYKPPSKMRIPGYPPEVFRRSPGFRQSMISGLRNCDYWQCWPSGNGQQKCVYVPCSGGRV